MKRETAPHFLDGGGELGALMRAKDWSDTPLGPLDTWPQSLRTAVSILLNSRYPMFIFWGPQHTKIYNDGYRPITGDKHPWALGRPGTEVWPEIWDAIGPMVERVVQQGEATWSDDLQLFMHRRGFPEEVFFTFSYSPIRDESGGIGGMFCACTETTVKVQGERRLRLLRDLAAAPAEARNVADACRLSVALLAGNRADIPFALLYLFGEDGPVLAAAAGTAPEDVTGDWPLDARAEVSELPARFRRVPAGPWPEPPSRAMVLPLADHAHDKPSGALVLGISSRALFDDAYRDFFGLVAGQLAASLANARASEEERRRAEALAEIDRAKTAFFSNVSHEFRTPLTLMLGPVDDLLADAEQPLPSGQREQLELVRRNGLRLQKLVNALLDFSRIEAGRAQASYASTDLAALTADIASTFRSAIERAGLRLVVDCPSLPEPAYVDADMWEKIVLNLLSNAFKFTFEGEIEVALRRGAAGFELKVRDTGTGIPSAELPRMFERFHRIAGARGRTHEGTGIGLALVHELVRLHRGSIAVQSTPGAGTVFTVCIPAGKAHLPADRLGVARLAASSARGAELFADEALRWQPEAAPAPGDAQPGRRERILWADDNADMRDYVRRLLSVRYEVEAVADGEAALAAARIRRPDLVLADVMMPGLDGLGLARALRADPHTRSIPIILLSARAGEESRIEGLDAGADDYLYKPFGARELLAQVAARLELSRLQARLQQERAELANLFQQTPVPTAVLQGAELVFEMANPAYLAAVDGRDILGKPLLEALPEARGQGFDELLREVMRTGRPHVGHETPMRLERGGKVEERYFTFIYAPLRGTGGDIDRAIAIVNDVTEQVRARKQLEDFLATLAHELRNPLAPIRNAVNLLQQAEGDALVRQRAQSILARQVDHMIRLVDDLLDIARVSRGRISLQRQAVRLDAVIESAVETSRPLVEAGGHRLSIELPQEPVMLSGDALRLAQVIANLLNNAARYTPHAGRIALTARSEAGWVSIAVQDDGIGIEPESLPRLFDMFGQVESARRRAPGGLGIGLALARQLVELHGGRIEARSRGTGLGSEFIVRLPTLHSAPAQAAPVRSDPAPSEKRRILVVDDNTDAALALGMVLEQMGHTVEIAHDGASALHAARQDPPEVILADLDLPGLDGFGLATRLREDRRFDRVPIIAVSGFGQVGDRKRARQAGFDEHLVKPVDAAVLCSALQLIDWKTL